MWPCPERSSWDSIPATGPAGPRRESPRRSPRLSGSASTRCGPRRPMARICDAPQLFHHVRAPGEPRRARTPADRRSPAGSGTTPHARHGGSAVRLMQPAARAVPGGGEPDRQQQERHAGPLRRHGAAEEEARPEPGTRAEHGGGSRRSKNRPRIEGGRRRFRLAGSPVAHEEEHPGERERAGHHVETSRSGSSRGAGHRAP